MPLRRVFYVLCAVATLGLCSAAVVSDTGDGVSTTTVVLATSGIGAGVAGVGAYAWTEGSRED